MEERIGTQTLKWLLIISKLLLKMGEPLPWAIWGKCI